MQQIWICGIFLKTSKFTRSIGTVVYVAILLKVGSSTVHTASVSASLVVSSVAMPNKLPVRATSFTNDMTIMRLMLSPLSQKECVIILLTTGAFLHHWVRASRRGLHHWQKCRRGLHHLHWQHMQPQPNKCMIVIIDKTAMQLQETLAVMFPCCLP